jgi:nucleoside-diphosphate-sugar epimerase
VRIVITGEGRVSRVIFENFLAKWQAKQLESVHMLTHQDCRDERIPECDVLIHAGARVFAQKSISVPGPYIQDNIIDTFDLLQWAKRKRPALIVYLSTHEVENVWTPYAATKAAAEALVRAWGYSYGLPYLIIRLPNLFIPDYKDRGLVGRVLRGEKIELIKETRQWLDGDDFAEQLWNIIQTKDTNRVIKLAGFPYTTQQIVDRAEGWKVGVR